MKKAVLFSILISITGWAAAQMKNPVSWDFSATKKSDKVYEITATASMAGDWHIYSQTTPKGGPVPTKFTFKANPLIVMSGIPAEKGQLKNVHDPVFGVDVKYFGNKVAFVQTVQLKSKVKTQLTGEVEYMVCDDTQCLPPKKVPFEIKLQ